MTYENKLFQFDNWNIQDYYKEKSWPFDDLRSVQVMENGPYRYALKFQWQYLNMPIIEIVYCYANSPRVNFCFHADWQEAGAVAQAYQRNNPLVAVVPVHKHNTLPGGSLWYWNTADRRIRRTS